jgi:hypothetical protein
MRELFPPQRTIPPMTSETFEFSGSIDTCSRSG